MLQSQIELLEQILLRHSIDINASIAHLQADKNPTRDPPGCLYDKTASSAAQRVSQPSEPDGALCSKDSFGVEDDGEVSYFGLSSGRVELLQSNGCMVQLFNPFHFLPLCAEHASGYRYDTLGFAFVSPLSPQPILPGD